MVIRDVCTISLETELLDDLVLDLERVGRALPTRHGPAFRDLDRRLGDLVAGRLRDDDANLQQVEPGRLVLIPPSAWRAIVDDAKALGVI
jgi:hypothetical protein